MCMQLGVCVFAAHVLSSQCVLSVSDLLAAYSEPLFYDIFLVQQNTAGDERLLAVPILNLILQFSGQFVNQGNI